MFDPWAEVDGPSRKDRLSLRRVSASHPMDLYWGKDSLGGYWFCFHGRLSAPSKLKLPQLGGIEVSIQRLEDGESPEWELALELENKAYEDLFRALCGDLVHATESLGAGQDDAAATILVQRLCRWQTLLNRRSSILLNYTERLGLFGEILVLRECLKPRLGIEAAVRSWRGPTGSEQDFLLSGGVLEVKSQLATDDRAIRISSTDQLDEISGPIWLCHQRFSNNAKDSDSPQTLNDVISEIRTDLQGADFLSAELFETRLIELGYVTRDEYDADSWALTGRSFYEIFGDFPRIKTGELRSGIERVTYSIRLSSCNEYLVDENYCLERAVDDYG